MFGVDWIIRITEETKGCFCGLVILCWHWPSFISDSDNSVSLSVSSQAASCLELKHTSLLVVHGWHCVVIRCRYWQDRDVWNILCDCFCRASSRYVRKRWAHPGQYDSSYKPRYVDDLCSVFVINDVEGIW